MTQQVYAIYQDGCVTILTHSEWLDWIEDIRQQQIDEIMGMSSDLLIDTYRPDVLFDEREI